MKITHFNIDMNKGETPYFQVSNGKSVRFYFHVWKKTQDC